MTQAQEKILEKHGTLAEFTDALWLAHGDLFITLDEVNQGIEAYKADWEQAGTQTRPVNEPQRF